MFSLALFSVALFAYALVSKRVSTTMVTGPMLFAALGLVVGPEGLDIISVELDTEFVQLLLEGTLVLVLFADAAVIDVRAARREAFLPGRLLGIGLPLTMVAGVLAALVLFDQIGVWEAANEAGVEAAREPLSLQGRPLLLQQPLAMHTEPKHYQGATPPDREWAGASRCTCERR